MPTLRAEIAWCLGHERARRGQRPRRPLDARRGARRPLRGAAARRSGPRARTTPTTASASCAPTPMRPSTAASASLIIDMKAPGITHAAAARADRPRPRRLQRGVLRRRGGAARPPGRPAEPGLVDLGGLARARARHDVALERRAARRHARAPARAGARDAGPTAAASARAPTLPRRSSRASTSTRRRCGSWATGASRSSPRGKVSPEHSVLKLFGSEISAARRARRDRGPGRRRARRRASRAAATTTASGSRPG